MFSEQVWIGTGFPRPQLLVVTGGTVIGAHWLDRRTETRDTGRGPWSRPVPGANRPVRENTRNVQTYLQEETKTMFRTLIQEVLVISEAVYVRYTVPKHLTERMAQLGFRLEHSPHRPKNTLSTRLCLRTKRTSGAERIVQLA